MSHQKVAHNAPSQGSVVKRKPDVLDSAMLDVMDRGRCFTDRGIPVLLLGETGTGKEVVARKLHEQSTRGAQPLITLNCASIPESLVESELFGYARGAFSGALPGGMKGKIEAADGGTLFLDEIGDMPLNQQARLLRALSEREITPLGATKPVPVDFQLICATHQDLPKLVRTGAFRSDLFYRIAVGILRLPTLRERADFEILVSQIAEEEFGGSVSIETSTWELLLECEWPGNIRQLRAALRCACALSKDGTLRPHDLPLDLILLPPAVPSLEAERSIHSSLVNKADIFADANPSQKRERVIQVLAGSRWNMSAAAKNLGICRSTLYRQLKSLGITHIKDAEVALSSASPVLAARR
ncbi:sigma-54-dependent Fis family transcriptional regulator [Caballeronia sp. TF1N1]|uniref:sigma-54-dependent Fis family transcriptional regulator n=1 Tax=Caballeronia sp. TF1N1 TaxID=2878153 RepID=UPI001FD40136|nr:sigma-54 dependent transcriptional regulator [Caballeronia sp. TF1N1]